MNQIPQVAVIGAGVGGLAAAIRLARQGFSVDVFEKAKTPGGRAGQLSFGGYHFDTGPTILLMPEILRELFDVAGRNLDDYLELIRCDPNYRIHFRDGSDVTFSPDLTQMQREMERVEPGSFGHYLDFLKQGHGQYRASIERFVGRNFDSLLQFLTPSNLKKVMEIKALAKMYTEVGKHFADPRLRAALTFQTMYLGISPFEAPAVYGLLPYVELALGIWFPRGGLYAIPLALDRLARELGVRMHYGEAVSKITFSNGRATGVLLESGDEVLADAVLCNADLPWAYRNLIDPAVTTLPRKDKLKYTSSAFMFYWGLDKSFSGLLHHNVFFGADYRASFDDIFKRGTAPADPSFYVNVPNRTDERLAPSGKDAVYVLVPTPNDAAGVDWQVEGNRLRALVLERLRSEGFDLAPHIAAEKIFTPHDYASSLNLERGAAFGLSHNFMQIGPFRPANVDRKVKNLFFVGASTQPGTGLPMVVLSARLVSERLQQWAQANAFLLRPREPIAAAVAA